MATRAATIGLPRLFWFAVGLAWGVCIMDIAHDWRAGQRTAEVCDGTH